MMSDIILAGLLDLISILPALIVITIILLFFGKMVR